jgi:hypothetical protein
MLLVIPRRALNVPLSRWSVAAMIVVSGTFASGMDGHPPRPIGTLMGLGLAALASVAYALSTTFYLRVRGVELRIVTIYKRSSLALSRSYFWSASVGRGRAQSWVLTVSDGSVKRQLRNYLFDWTAQLAIRRLEKRLLPDERRKKQQGA